MGLVYKNGSLHFGESDLLPILPLTKGRTEPFYLYDLDGMRTRVCSLATAFRGIEIHYAMKANSTERIMRVFQEEGTGVDVVSGGEIECALRCGFDPEIGRAHV